MKFLDVLVGSIILFILAFVISLFVLVSSAHAATSSKHSNSLGVTTYSENPYIYLAGSLATSPDAVDVVDGNLNLRIKPSGTYMLFEQSVLLCGMPTDKFRGVTEPFVMTYERIAHHAVQGIGCHELLSVDSIKSKETAR